MIFLPHGCPDVAVKHVCVLNGRDVIAERNRGTGFRRYCGDPFEHLGLHLIDQGLRAVTHKGHAHFCAAVHPGIAHIISNITDKNYLAVLQGLCNVFLHGHHIGKDLGGMVHVRKAVKYGNAGISCQIFDDRLFVSTIFNSVKEAAKNFCGVLQRFLFTHL